MPPKALPITWEIIGPCQKAPMDQGSLEVENLKESSVGEVTLKAFKNGGVSFDGNESMIKNIEGLPGRFEYLPLKEGDFRSLGWCYQVNGKEPPLYMNKVFFASQKDHLKWVLGQASFIKGEWVEYCTPVHHFTYSFFCEEESE